MDINVYVVNQNGHSLMPCTPAKARHLLEAGKAKVIGRSPFTIQLLWECEEQVQQVMLGIDKGSHHTGLCCVGNGTILLSAEIEHREDVKTRMDDQIAQHSMQGKTYLYTQLRTHVPLSTLFGYQTATFRKARRLPKTHDADALCIATYETGELVSYERTNFYQITFRPRRTRRQYHTLPRKGQGRVKYQVNEELEGFHKGDIVRVKGKHIKQINSIYSHGRLAFKRVKGEPPSALPKDCQLLERERTILWEKVS